MEAEEVLYYLTLFTFAVIFLFCYIRYVYTYFERNRIPGLSTPRFPWGNLGDVVFNDSPLWVKIYKYHARLRKRKQPLGGFYVLLKPAVITVDAELIHKEQYFDSLCPNQKWDNEKILKAADSKIFDNVIKSSRNSWSEIISDVPTGDQVNFSKLTSRQSADLALQTILGQDLKDLDQNLLQIVPEFPVKPNQYWANLRKFTAMCYPSLVLFPDKKKLAIKEILENQMTKRKKNDLKRNDAIEILMQSDLTRDQQVQFILHLLDILDSTSSLIQFCLYELSCSQEIQDELRGEILRHKKQESELTSKDLDGLRYLETVIRETLRKYPTEPFICKKCRSDYRENEKTHIKKGTLVFASPFGIHHDPENYTNPEKFDPDRFSEENLRFIEPFKYLPFGSRSQGEFSSSYLTLVLKVALIELLSSFKFTLGDKSRMGLKFDEGTSGMRLKDGLWLNVEKI